MWIWLDVKKMTGVATREKYLNIFEIWDLLTFVVGPNLDKINKKYVFSLIKALI